VRGCHGDPAGIAAGPAAREAKGTKFRGPCHFPARLSPSATLGFDRNYDQGRSRWPPTSADRPQLTHTQKRRLTPPSSDPQSRGHPGHRG
jgi:hypothetical protein